MVMLGSSVAVEFMKLILRALGNRRKRLLLPGHAEADPCGRDELALVQSRAERSRCSALQFLRRSEQLDDALK